MRILKYIRFSMGTIMMFVLAAAAGSALYAKVRSYSGVIPHTGWKTDVPILCIVAVALTAVTLAAWKDHSSVLAMLQFSLACVGCLTLTWIVEAQWERGVRYWYQGTFALTVTLPILIRSYAKTRMPRGPRRDRAKRVCEAVFFSYLNILLVTIGILLQGLVYATGEGIGFAAGAGAVSIPPTAAVPTPTGPVPVLPPSATKAAAPKKKAKAAPAPPG
jgi:hypothetical protein